MLIIDGDYPMGVGAIGLDRDLTLPIEEMRAAPPSARRSDAGFPNDQILATLPEMRRGKIAVALVKVVSRIHHSENPFPDTGYRSAENAYAAGQAHLAYYRILEARGESRILRTSQDFSEHMRVWSEAPNHDDLPVGMVVGIEGADSILWPEQVREWWEGGVRVVGLTYGGISTYGHGEAIPEGGLFPPAGDLLRHMESLGMILDVTHTADESVRQSLELFAGPVIASHQNCRALVPGARQMPDELLTAVIDRGGVIGVSMATWMLYRAYEVNYGHGKTRRDVFPRDAVTLKDVADHIDHVCQLAGNALHAAIGGDTDGQSAPGGKDGFPHDIDTVADFQKLVDVLDGRSYSRVDVANVMHGNWQRFYEKWLPQNADA